MRPNPENSGELIFSPSETALMGITTLPLECVEFACTMLDNRITIADQRAGSSPFPENMKQAYMAQSLRALKIKLIEKYLPEPSDDEYAFLLGVDATE